MAINLMKCGCCCFHIYWKPGTKGSGENGNMICFQNGRYNRKHKPFFLFVSGMANKFWSWMSADCSDYKFQKDKYISEESNYYVERHKREKSVKKSHLEQVL
jgi:hypothetical protein